MAEILEKESPLALHLSAGAADGFLTAAEYVAYVVTDSEGQESLVTVQSAIKNSSSDVSALEAKVDAEISRSTTTDEGLQEQIDAITSQSDVVDVVGTKAELDAYSKPIYKDDIVKVLQDESEGDAITYYRLTTDVIPPAQPQPPYTWAYIGKQGPFYTKSETDRIILNEKTERQDADTQLQTNITAEENRATAKEAEISLNLTTESQRAVAKENEISQSLSDEVDRAQQAESDLLEKINDEEERATSVEQQLRADLSEEIQSRISDVNAEETRATARENEIEASIGNAKLIIQKNGTQVAQFTANQSGNDVVANIEADIQVQSDWNEADTTDPAFIKNKPDVVLDIPTSDNKQYVRKNRAWSEIQIPEVPVKDVKVDGTSVVDASGTANINNKITDPSTKHENQVLTFDGTTWVAKDASGGTITDVTRNGSSIVTDGVAAINNAPNVFEQDSQPTDAVAGDLWIDTDEPGFDIRNKIDNPEQKSAGQVLTFNGTTWVAQDASGGTITDVKQNGTSVVVDGVADVTVPTKTSELSNDSGFIVNADITVTPAMVISQDPLTLQLSAEQDAVIQNEANDFIRLDATALGVGSSIFTKTKSNVAGDFILTNAICEYSTSTYLPQRATTNVVIYHSATKVGIYSVIDSITSENAEHVSNKVTSIDEHSDNDQYPSAKAVYDAVEAGGKVKDVKVNNTSVVQSGIANIDLTGKQDVISDLQAIRSGATAGSTAVQPATLLSYSLVTETGNKIDLQIDSSTYVLKATLKDKNNNLISTSTEIDLPLETMVVGASYDSSTKEIVLTLKNGNTVRFSVADLVSGLENTSNKVTDISSSSTDTQYPSAKAVKDYVDNHTPEIIVYSISQPIGDWGLWCKYNNYLCFTALEDANISWVINGTLTNTPQLKYKIDNGAWNNYTFGDTVSLTTGQKCYWHGTTNTFSEGDSNYIKFTSTGRVTAVGEVDSLINWAPLTDWCYYWMFLNCTNLITAPELPSTILAPDCYNSMFDGCSSLQMAPELPAIILTTECYCCMFSDCTSLVLPPALPANTLALGCYYFMFNGCVSLTSAPELPATTLANYCYCGMFQNCTSLASIPALPAITLVEYCYDSMFSGCSNIRISTNQTGEYQTPYRIPVSGTGTFVDSAFYNMIYGTGGTFTNNPTINTTYYTSNIVI